MSTEDVDREEGCSRGSESTGLLVAHALTPRSLLPDFTRQKIKQATEAKLKAAWSPGDARSTQANGSNRSTAPRDPSVHDVQARHHEVK